ncbi:MAG: hypothetical protein E7653_06660 [Ruminococcaceae bacterium]|nr:hypothetical protein [Oscillospiraceae bacterium]
MKRTIICNIPMKKDTPKCKYVSEIRSLHTPETEVVYPINAYLKSTLKNGDELKVILLTKNDEYSHCKEKVEVFKAELADACKNMNVVVEYKEIETDFLEKKSVYQELMGKLVAEIPANSTVVADITYGPKDLPITVFAALSFAEKHLDCNVEHVIYGQANFDENGKAVNTRLCDMVPLLYIMNVANGIHSNDPEKAKQMLNSLLSL